MLEEKANRETKPQYKIFDTIVSWKIFGFIRPLYEWNRGFWIYCFLGFLSTGIDFVLSLLLAKVFVRSATIATTIAWIVSTFVSFVLFRYFYFDRTNNTFMNEFIKFVPTRLFTMGVSELCILFFVDILGASLVLVKLVLIPVTAILNYFTSKLFVFK